MKRTALQRKTELKARAPMRRKPVQKAQKARRKTAQKDTRWRSERYLAFVRSLPCSVCGTTRGVVAHHLVGMFSVGGMGLKAPDSYSMPLCDGPGGCHAMVHAHKHLREMQPGWLIDTLNRGLDHFTDDEIVGDLIKALEFVAEKEHQPWA